MFKTNRINQILSSFASGAISAFILIFIFSFIQNFHIHLDDAFKYQLYRLMVWGGVWAIVLVIISLYTQKNFLKFIILGSLVVFFNFIVKMPLEGSGFFAIHAGLKTFLMNIVFNYLWALLTVFIYQMAITKDKS